MKEERFTATKLIKQEACIASCNYIHKVILALQENSRDAELHTEEFECVPVWLKKLRGLTGVETGYSEDSIRKDIRARSTDWPYGDWMKILIPSDELFIDLSKNFECQSLEVKNALLGTRALDCLFIDDANKIRKNMMIPQEKQDALLELYEIKRKFLLGLTDMRTYINFLNEKQRKHDSDMTSSYLYFCGIKGIIYETSEGKKILLINARADIDVTDVRRQKCENFIS